MNDLLASLNKFGSFGLGNTNIQVFSVSYLVSGLCLICTSEWVP